MRIVFAAIAAFVFSSPALDDGPLSKIITKRDQQRLNDLEKSREAALAEARNGAGEAELAALDTILSGTELSFGDGFDMTGNWRCRTIKVGRSVPLVIYDWFNCRVSDDGSGWRLEKTNGSQRTSGRFYSISDTRLVYFGALHMSAEAPLPYGKIQERDQVAVVTRAEPNRIRLEFPQTVFDSNFDVLELQR